MDQIRAKEYLALQLIGTPLERPLRWIRSIPELLDRRRHPEWNSVRDEGKAIDRLLKDVIKENSNCIDIGCHLGAMLNAMQRLAPKGVHVAFEPTPYKARWLRQRYPAIEIRPEALSDQPGTVEFYCQSNQSGFSGLRSHKVAGSTTTIVPVKCVRLDDVISEYQIDFIKIDVEGAELLALSGADRTLQRYKPDILFECTLSGLELYGKSPDDAYDLFVTRYGYDIYKIDDWLSGAPPLPRHRFAALMTYPAQAFNFFASVRRPGVSDL